MLYDTLSAVSSITNEVWRELFSVPVNVIVPGTRSGVVLGTSG